MGVLGRPLSRGRAWSQEVAAGHTLVQVKLLPGKGHPYFCLGALYIRSGNRSEEVEGQRLTDQGAHRPAHTDTGISLTGVTATSTNAVGHEECCGRRFLWSLRRERHAPRSRVLTTTEMQ